MIESASDSASCWSWVTSSALAPAPRRMAATSSRRVVRRPASSDANGSSSSTTSGSVASARASATRCRSPPESSWGNERARCGEADELEALLDPTLARSCRSRRCRQPMRCGNRAPSWKTIPTRRRSGSSQTPVAGDDAVADPDRARVGHLEPGDDAQQRRLARSARAEQRDELAPGHRDGWPRRPPRVAPNDFVMSSAWIASGPVTRPDGSRPAAAGEASHNM